MYISVFFVAIFIMLALMIVDVTLYIMIFAFLFILSIFLFGISPLTTSHQIDPSGILLRQGILFKIELGWDEISSLERLEDRKLGLGLSSSIWKPLIPLTIQKNNLILIKLNQSTRFSSVLWKKSEEILIDVNDPDGFVSRAEKYLGIGELDS